MLRNRLIAKLSFRNLFRRKGTTFLVILGSLVGTSLIAGSLVIRDSFFHTANSAVEETLGEIDAVMKTTSTGFGAEQSQQIISKINESDLVDDAAGLLSGGFTIKKITGDQGGIVEPNVTLLSGNWPELNKFGSVFSSNIQITEPFQGEVFLSKVIADRIDVSTGDSITIFTPHKADIFKVATIYEGKGLLGFVEEGSRGNMILNYNDALTLYEQTVLVYNTFFISSTGGIQPEQYDAVEFVSDIQRSISELGISETQYSLSELKEVLISQISGGGVAEVFLVLSVFVIIAGSLLIINIYSMLAVERKSEMGIMRAIAFTRFKLMQSFLYEGFFYSLISALAGVVVGIGIGYLLVALISYFVHQFLEQFGIDARILFDITPLSLIIAFSTGLLTTYVTVFISSFLISRLDIVSAIRNIPSEKKKRHIIFRIFATLFLLFLLLQGCSLYASAAQIQKALKESGSEQVIDGYLLYSGFIILLLSGTALLNKGARLIIKNHYKRLISQTLYTFLSLAIFLYSIYALGGDQFSETFESSPFFFFLTGFGLVIAACIFITYNLDLIIRISKLMLSPFRSITSMVKIALRYPAAHRSRTGLTMTMFAIIIYLVILISIMKASQSAIIEQFAGSLLGGYDVVVTTSPTEPHDEVVDMIENFEKVDRYTEGLSFTGTFPEVEVDLSATTNYRQQQNGVLISLSDEYTELIYAPDDEFLGSIDLKTAKIKEGISEEEVFDELSRNNNAIILGSLYSYTSSLSPLPKWGVGDTVKLSYPGTDITVEKEIIAILALGSDIQLGNIIMPQDALKEDLNIQYEQFPTNKHVLMSFTEGNQNVETTKELKSELAKVNVFNVFDAKEFVATIQVFTSQFIYILQGFLSFGLLVGLAGLAVIMTRSVSERRQQIGMLRSLGFSRSMIMQSFMLESSIISILGITIGVVTATISGASFINQFGEEIETLRFVFPAGEIAVIVITVYIFSLIFALLPALKAAKLQPSEATRYSE